MKNIKKAGFIIDPIETLKPERDTSLYFMEEAKRRGYEVFYFEQKDLVVKNNILWAKSVNLFEFDLIFMRKDPPINMEYIYTTQLLDLAEQAGVKIINNPQALRAANEKLFTLQFPQCCVPTLVTNLKSEIKEFLSLHKDIILKPLDSMGGKNIFRVTEKDFNLNVIVETLLPNKIMAQKYIPEVKQGDKRIFIMHGQLFPYAISRFAAEGETRANLMAGGSWQKAEITDRDRWICDQLGPTLKEMGLLLVGIDVIGDYLTEINVTSPTCLREIDQVHGTHSAAVFFDGLL